jgi:hypothetical protein
MKIYAGLTAKKVFTLDDYSAADGWSVSAGLVVSDQTNINLGNLSGDGTEWTLTIPISTSIGIPLGDHSIVLYAAKDGEIYLAHREAVTAAAYSQTDMRSHNEIVLAQLRTVIQTKSTKDHASLSIDGQAISRMPWDEIIKAEKHYARLVAAEKRAATGGTRINNVQIGFSG